MSCVQMLLHHCRSDEPGRTGNAHHHFRSPFPGDPEASAAPLPDDWEVVHPEGERVVQAAWDAPTRIPYKGVECGIRPDLDNLESELLEQASQAVRRKRVLVKGRFVDSMISRLECGSAPLEPTVEARRGNDGNAAWPENTAALC